MMNIKRYDEFKENLNEGLFDTLRNLFASMFKGVADEFTKPFQAYAQQLKGAKLADVPKLLKGYLRINRDTLVKQFKGTTDLSQVRKNVKDNLMTIYSAMDATSKLLGPEKYNPKEFLSGAPAPTLKQFTQDEKRFTGTLDAYATQLFNLSAKAAGYKDEDLKSLPAKIDDVPKEAQKAPAKEEVKTTANQGGVQAQAPQAQTPGTGTGRETGIGQEQESRQYPRNWRPLHETAAVAPAAQTPVKPDPKLEVLKKNLLAWFDKTLYAKLDDPFEAAAKAGGPTEKVRKGYDVNQIKSTGNKEGVAKMIDRIMTTTGDPKKDNRMYAAVRDALVREVGVDERDIGTF